jgi:hypothetical protein
MAFSRILAIFGIFLILLGLYLVVGSLHSQIICPDAGDCPIFGNNYVQIVETYPSNDVTNQLTITVKMRVFTTHPLKKAYIQVTSPQYENLTIDYTYEYRSTFRVYIYNFFSEYTLKFPENNKIYTFLFYFESTGGKADSKYGYLKYVVGSITTTTGGGSGSGNGFVGDSGDGTTNQTTTTTNQNFQLSNRTINMVLGSFLVIAGIIALAKSFRKSE